LRAGSKRQRILLRQTGRPSIEAVLPIIEAVASWWRAQRAVEVLPVVWDAHGNHSVSSASITEMVRSALDEETPTNPSQDS